MSFREIKSLAKDHTAGEYIAFVDRREKRVGGCFWNECNSLQNECNLDTKCSGEHQPLIEKI